jgi:hypothetical protein
MEKRSNAINEMKNSFDGKVHKKKVHNTIALASHCSSTSGRGEGVPLAFLETWALASMCATWQWSAASAQYSL